MTDPYNLQRFVDAQDAVFEKVLAELRAGEKRSHWMWFIFPQLKGLGRSEMADTFGVSSQREAEAYLLHPLLGSRLRECSRLVNMVEGRSIEQIFGYPDDLKFHSSMTLFLFASATADNEVFEGALRKYFGGKRDPRTVERL
jgi:uncharacterized protein (DUF1810 family)